MDPHAELEQLLAGQFDDAPDEARRQKLRDLLKAHPELQKDYVELMQLHALLQWRGGKTAPRPSEPATRSAARARGWGSRTALAAALLVMAASIAYVLLVLLPDGPAPDQIFERLIDLNLEMAETPALEERGRIYTIHLVDLKTTLEKTRLNEKDRETAEMFLENSDWLTRNDDPIAKAQRFNDLADRLVDRLDAVTATRDVERVERFADAYRRLAVHGVDANQEKALASVNLDIDKKKKLAQIQHNEEARAKKLEQMIERHPEPLRKAFRRGMKGHPMKKK